jgi:hypothetical protein
MNAFRCDKCMEYKEGSPNKIDTIGTIFINGKPINHYELCEKCYTFEKINELIKWGIRQGRYQP